VSERGRPHSFSLRWIGRTTSAGRSVRAPASARRGVPLPVTKYSLWSDTPWGYMVRYTSTRVPPTVCMGGGVNAGVCPYSPGPSWPVWHSSSTNSLMYATRSAGGGLGEGNREVCQELERWNEGVWGVSHDLVWCRTHYCLNHNPHIIDWIYARRCCVPIPRYKLRDMD